jgi:SH3-like domain-containing protein
MRETGRDDIILRKGIISGFFAASIGFAPGVQAQTLGPETGDPLPRFETLRFDTVRMRRGPGREYPIAWVFKREGLPVEVFREYEDWRQVRDPFGDIGWIKRTQLSRARYGLVVAEENTPLRNRTEGEAKVVALAAPGVVLRLDECRLHWCHGRAKGYSGWVRKEALFGVTPEETFKGE